MVLYLPYSITDPVMSTTLIESDMERNAQLILGDIDQKYFREIGVNIRHKSTDNGIFVYFCDGCTDVLRVGICKGYVNLEIGAYTCAFRQNSNKDYFVARDMIMKKSERTGLGIHDEKYRETALHIVNLWRDLTGLPEDVTIPDAQK